MNILPLKWDSDFFNLNIGKVEKVDVNEFLSLQNKEQFDLIYIEENKNGKQILEFQKIANIKYTDKKTIYNKPLKNKPSLNNEITIYSSTKANKKLVELAIQSGKFSRFKLDKNFENASFEKLYTQWIENSVSKKSANIVLIFGSKKQPKGFITIAFKGTFAQIGLIAVDENEQNQGIGKALIDAATTYVVQNNFTTLQVITQTINTDACRFYEGCGFVKINEIYTHHYWNR